MFRIILSVNTTLSSLMIAHPLHLAFSKIDSKIYTINGRELVVSVTLRSLATNYDSFSENVQFVILKLDVLCKPSE